MIRLYIIDDHFLIVEGLYASFNLESSEIKVVGGSLTIDDALQKISPEFVDIIILDLFLQQSEPVSNVSILRKKFPNLPIVILSYENCLSWKVEMFQNGVKAYLNKNDNKLLMKETLLRVAAGETVPIAEHSSSLFQENSEEDFLFDLCNRGIINNLANGMSIKEIAILMNQSNSAIEKRINKIRKYYNAKNNVELIFKVILDKFRFDT